MPFLKSLAHEVRHTPVFWFLPLLPVALLYQCSTWCLRGSAERSGSTW